MMSETSLRIGLDYDFFLNPLEHLRPNLTALDQVDRVHYAPREAIQSPVKSDMHFIFGSSALILAVIGSALVLSLLFPYSSKGNNPHPSDHTMTLDQRARFIFWSVVASAFYYLVMNVLLYLATVAIVFFSIGSVKAFLYFEHSILKVSVASARFIDVPIFFELNNILYYSSFYSDLSDLVFVGRHLSNHFLEVDFDVPSLLSQIAKNQLLLQRQCVFFALISLIFGPQVFILAF